MSHPHAPPPGDAHADRELPIAGFKGTPEEIERQWYEQVYRGRGDSMAQLTLRAVLMGSLLGGVLSLTNLYIGLKSGWGFGVAITACILSYAIWTTLYGLKLVRSPMTVLENNCMQSTASSAGYSTGGTLISAFAAYIMLNNASLSLELMLGWVFVLAVLGVTMAIPMKRQMINIEQLRFPSGVAAAETLRALHSHGDSGMRSARALGIAGILAAASKFWTEGLALFSAALAPLQISTWVTKFNVATVGPVWMNRGVMFMWEPLFIAAGAITGMRVCVSMMVGAVLCWMVFVPYWIDQRVITLTVTEPIPVTLEGARFGSEPTIARYASYNDKAGLLKWEGPMSAADRARLAALFPDPWVQAQFDRLYVRSQFRAAEPLAARPAEFNAKPELAGLLEFADGELRLRDLISPEQYDGLRAASGDPHYLKALAALYERSLLPGYEPLWASVPLPESLRNMKIPESLSRRMKIASSGSAVLLLWRGPMSDTERAAVAKISDAPGFAALVDELAAAAGRRTLTGSIPDALTGWIALDEENRALRTRGPAPTEGVDQAIAAIESDVVLSAAVNNLLAASEATRAKENFRDLVAWTLWGGTACMVTSGLLAFALQWRSALRAFSGLTRMFGGRSVKSDDPLEAIETPTSWFVFGQFFALIAICWLAHESFGMPYWQSVLAVVLTFGLALVACRVTGETDTTPIGAMGKIMQLTFGVVHPAKVAGDVTAMNVNLMAANITAGAAGSSADLLTDLKSGYLLGANPRKQFIAQFCGIFTGTIVTVFAFRLMVPSADVLGTSQFPAPAAQAWRGVAEALSNGLDRLEPLKLWSILIGGAVGVVLPILSMAAPAKAKVWIPSAAGVGLAWVFNWYYALLFLIGAIIGWIIEKSAPKVSKEFTFPVASGIIAGESLMGVALIFVENGPGMWQRLFGG
ncbi:MAG: OPT/YSL family transporter [Planctomycetia bacterium]|nr:MAG: OPT/YSL family transporter [Planctomycetia bacterium]